MTFTLYIRVIIHVSQFWMICSITEIYETDLSSIATASSFVFACIIISIIVAFSITNITMIFDSSDVSKSVCKEFFTSIKESKKAKLYNVVMMVRRVVLVSLMVCLINIDKVYLVILAVIYQIMHTALIVWIRPYKSVKDNINEIMIDSVFSVLLVFLIHFHTKDSWNEVATSFYFYLLGFPGMFIFLTSIGMFD